MSKEKCKCGEVANWLLMSASENHNNPFYCEKCVPRGCSCNNSYNVEDATEMLQTFKNNGEKYKIENGIVIPLNDDGKEYPCCEFDYEKEGFDVDEK